MTPVAAAIMPAAVSTTALPERALWRWGVGEQVEGSDLLVAHPQGQGVRGSVSGGGREGREVRPAVLVLGEVPRRGPALPW
ncbi:hypothetical protein ACFY7H_12225 [Streptomyces sp. NPDC012794]|uniref:hypothetical protein n=1 Tax=Streptomyces sp. NPDC012794 TaxID=3364850 RepID=UPI00369E7568